MTDFSTCIKVFHLLAILAIQVNGTPLPQQNELVHGQPPPPPPPPPPQQANDLIHGVMPPPPPPIQQSDFIHGVSLPQQQQDHSVDLTHPNKGLPTFAGEKPKKEIIFVLDDKKVAGHDANKAPVRSMFIEPFENKRTGEKEAMIITEQSPSSAMLDEHHYHHRHHPALMAVEEPWKKNDQQHSKHHHGQDYFNDDEDDGEYDDEDDYYDDDDNDDEYEQDRDERFNPSVYLKSKQHHLGNP